MNFIKRAAYLKKEPKIRVFRGALQKERELCYLHRLRINVYTVNPDCIYITFKLDKEPKSNERLIYMGIKSRQKAPLKNHKGIIPSVSYVDEEIRCDLFLPDVILAKRRYSYDKYEGRAVVCGVAIEKFSIYGDLANDITVHVNNFQFLTSIEKSISTGVDAQNCPNYHS